MGFDRTLDVESESNERDISEEDSDDSFCEDYEEVPRVPTLGSKCLKAESIAIECLARFSFRGLPNFPNRLFVRMEEPVKVAKPELAFKTPMGSGRDLKKILFSEQNTLKDDILSRSVPNEKKKFNFGGEKKSKVNLEERGNKMKSHKGFKQIGRAKTFRIVGSPGNVDLGSDVGYCSPEDRKKWSDAADFELVKRDVLGTSPEIRFRLVLLSNSCLYLFDCSVKDESGPRV